MITYNIYQRVSIINGRKEWVKLDISLYEDTAKNYVERERVLNPGAELRVVKVEETEMDF